MKLIQRYWENNPLKLIIFLSSVFLGMAVIFSKGFGMQDDHFLIIEVAQSWADGYDFNNWLPSNNPGAVPTGHSFFYTGLHFLFFKLMNLIGFYDPQGKMYIIRFIHALFSLLTIIYGFKITAKIAGIVTAKHTGLILGLLWFVPFLSVRNLVEIVCIPFLVYGTWRIISFEDRKIRYKFFYWLVTGIVFGMSVNFRLQNVLFLGGLGLALLILKKWKETFFIASGSVIALAACQWPTDLFFWGYPFAEFIEYIRYNATHYNDYIVLDWYNYILFLSGILIPPVSLFLFFGFLRTWRKHLVIFLPVFIFLAFHSYFPNKQERFIFPVVPFLIILGMTGWYSFVEKSKFREKFPRLLKASWVFFWTINLILLPVISTTYSKRSRVEAMVYLSGFEDRKYFILEDSNNDYVKLMPLYYAKHWQHSMMIDRHTTFQYLVGTMCHCNYAELPNYVLFCGDKNLDARISGFKKLFPDLKYMTTIDPGFIDYISYKMNPVNLNQQVFIYKINHTPANKERICKMKEKQ